MTDLARLYLSGHVRRWHQNPAMAGIGQTLADHAGRAVQLLLALNPRASAALVRHVAFHDVGELVAGDLSAPFKRANPDIATAHADLEAQARAAICGCDEYLTPREAEWAALVDRVEAAAYVLTTNPAEAFRAKSGWAEDMARATALAEALGCGEAVAQLFARLGSGDWS